MGIGIGIGIGICIGIGIKRPKIPFNETCEVLGKRYAYLWLYMVANLKATS